MRIFVTLLFLSFIHINNGFSQHVFLLLDGTKIQTEQFRLIDSLDIYTYKSGKGKMKVLDQDFVFSITDHLGKESVVYVPNDLTDNFSEKQMFAFIKGEQYARDYYSPIASGIGGFAVGLSSSVVFPEWGVNVFYSSFIPLAYTGVGVFSKHKVRKMNVPADCAFDEYYIKGYRAKAVKKRFIYTISGAMIGTGIGLGVNAYRMNH